MIRRVAFITFAQKVGLSLDEIRSELAKLPRNRAPERGDWARLSSGWKSRIDARITYRAALMGHGTREQRLSNFRAGYDRGAGACLSELAS